MLKTLFVLVLLLFLSSCSSNNDNTILNGLKFEPIVNPYTGIITYTYNLYIDHEQDFTYGISSYPYVADGYKSIYFFYTNDNFKTFHYSLLPCDTGVWRIFYRNVDILLATTVSNKDLRLIKSIDFGVSWSLLFIKNITFDEYYLGMTSVSQNEGWFFVYEDWERTQIYKFLNSSFEKISTLNNYCVKDYHFFNALEGYMIANTNDNVSPSTAPNTYFFKTFNGGKNWQRPIEISTERSSYKMICVNKEKIIVISGYFDSKYYCSNDSGKTWQIIETGSGSGGRDIYFLNSNIGYMIVGNSSASDVKGKVYKTIDGGENWDLKSSELIRGNSIKFIDENNGYVLGRNEDNYKVLLYSSNGGVNWKELIYPYDYVQ